LPLAGQSQHEFSINAGGGLSTLSYKPSVGKSASGFGGEVGLGYHFFFAPKLSIGTGVNLALYNSEATLNTYSNTYNATTLSNNVFEFTYAMTNYKENISAMMLTIPLMVQYQITDGKIGFYVAGGGKIGLPLSANYKTSIEKLETRGYSPELEVLFDDLPKYGLRNDYRGIDRKTDMKLNPAFMLSAEAGAKLRLGDDMSLYMGAYIDYGLNNMKKDKAASLIGFNALATSYPEGFEYNSMANSLSEKINSFAVGLKLRLSFGNSLFMKKGNVVADSE
jgi:hypothetical protein